MILFCSDRSRAGVLRLAALAVSAFLVACGGGGGGAGDGGTAVPELQGFYAGGFGAGMAQAIVLPDGEFWLVLRSGGAIRSAGRGEAAPAVGGARFAGVLTDLETGASEALTLDLPDAAARPALAGTLVAGARRATIRWPYDSRYETAQPIADVAGRWTGTLGQGRVGLTWDITAAGAIRGTSTTGCSYSGRLAPQLPATAVLVATVTERCPGLADLSLGGIATLDAAGDRASLLLAPPAGTPVAFLSIAK